jgi:hypothetical protein
MPLGIPLVDDFSFAPFKIIQTPGLIVMLYEVDSTHRQVYTDGRKLPADPQPAWLGYSVGKWEGDTLVVDTAGFNDKSWLDAFGHPHSEALRIQERFRRRDFGHMEVQVTIDDPKTFTKPFTIKFNDLLLPDTDILESFCTENEKDRPHLGQQEGTRSFDQREHRHWGAEPRISSTQRVRERYLAAGCQKPASADANSSDT